MIALFIAYIFAAMMLFGAMCYDIGYDDGKRDSEEEK